MEAASTAASAWAEVGADVVEVFAADRAISPVT